MLAAQIWHYWIGLILFLVSVVGVVAVIGGYLASVTSKRYPNKRQSADE
ncbi:MAG: hypothetical protein WCO88_10725 [Actinomycetota bacterium]|jgi:hypothetical protein